MVGHRGIYSSSGSHVVKQVFKGVVADRTGGIPDCAHSWIMFFALVSCFLKKATAFRVKMRQITLNCFYWTSTGAWPGENFPIGVIFAIFQSAWVIFRCENTSASLAVDLKILLSVCICLKTNNFFLIFAWFSPPRFPGKGVM